MIEERDVTPELLERLSRSAPRYTSYPTAVDWQSAFAPENYAQLLAAESERKGPLSLYAHIPFCPERCLYCGCNVVISRKRARVASYVERMLRELESLERAGMGRRALDQMHWGGGTPTYLLEGEIERLFRAVNGVFTFEPDADLSIEVDPRVTTGEQLDLLGELGFRRISIGVQDWDTRVQEEVHRVQSRELTCDVVEAARAAGFRSVNIDLIYGLPYQTRKSFSATIDGVLELRPERIALFHYAHVPWIKKHQRVLATQAMPSASEKLSIFLRSTKRLRAVGYQSIGLDHFALPSDELAIAAADGQLKRNFMGYTTRADEGLVPLGTSSIGELGGHYVQNSADESDYVGRIDQTGLACFRGHRLSAEDRLRRDVIVELMCNGHVNKPDIENRHSICFDQHFAVEMSELLALQDDGLVELHAGAIRLTDLGQLLMRNVALVFDLYFRERMALGGDAANTTYSKTL